MNKKTKIEDCPHLLYPKCNAPASRVEGKPFFHCRAIRELRNACHLENERKERGEK